MMRITKHKMKRNSRKVKSKTKKVPKPQRPRLARELRALVITPTDSESVHTINETPREVYSAITSDPGVPSAFEEAFFGPMSHVWRPEIYGELMSFISRKAFKKQNKKHVIEQLRRKRMTTKWIFKVKTT
jgi:hypothetical protein